MSEEDIIQGTQEQYVGMDDDWCELCGEPYFDCLCDDEEDE